MKPQDKPLNGPHAMELFCGSLVTRTEGASVVNTEIRELAGGTVPMDLFPSEHGTTTETINCPRCGVTVSLTKSAPVDILADARRSWNRSRLWSIVIAAAFGGLFYAVPETIVLVLLGLAGTIYFTRHGWKCHYDPEEIWRALYTAKGSNDVGPIIHMISPTDEANQKLRRELLTLAHAKPSDRN